MIRRPPRSTLVPYPTVFRSSRRSAAIGPLPSSGSNGLPARTGFEGVPLARRCHARARRPLAVGGGGRTARPPPPLGRGQDDRSEEHTSELQSRQYLVCRSLL